MQIHIFEGAVKIRDRLVRRARQRTEYMRDIRFGRESEPLYYHGELVGWKMFDGSFLPKLAGASRDHDMVLLLARAPAAAATTVTVFTALPNFESATAFLAEGFVWLYETAEANVDNSIDWDQTYGAAGTGTTLFTNVNPNGLLDTGAPSTGFTNRRNAAAPGGAAAAASDPADVRVAINQVIQTTIVSGGTGTIPGTQVNTFGKFI